MASAAGITLTDNAVQKILALVASDSTEDKGLRVKVVGAMNKIFAFVPRIAPRRVVTFITGVFLKRRW